MLALAYLAAVRRTRFVPCRHAGYVRAGFVISVALGLLPVLLVPRPIDEA